MGFAGSTLLKLLQTILYAITFCCAAVILGAYSYFLAVLSSNDLPIASWKKAVEGISGAAVLYLVFAVILTCFLGGKRIFALVAIVLNLLFAGGFVAIAILGRDGSKKCSGKVNTPIGDGRASNSRGDIYGDNSGPIEGLGSVPSDYDPDLYFACKLNRAAFIEAIAGAILFLLLLGLQLVIARKHKEEKQFQAAPGAGKRRFWQRKKKHRSVNPGAVESGYGPTKPEHQTYDPHYSAGSHPTNAGGTNTNYTGHTAVPGANAGTTYDSTGRPINNPYTAGPPGPYTNY